MPRASKKKLTSGFEKVAVLSTKHKRRKDNTFTDSEQINEIHGEQTHTSSEKIDLQFDEPSGSGLTNIDPPLYFKSNGSPTWKNSDDSIKDNSDPLVITYDSPIYAGTQDDENNVTISTKRKKINVKKLQQELRNKGLSYKTLRSKQEIQARKIKPLSTCRNNCSDKITLENQQQLFENYWALGSYNKRVLYISSMIHLKPKSSTKTKQSGIKHRDRQFTAEYIIEIEGEKIKVCRSCFLGCFDESNAFVRTVLGKKFNSPSTTLLDRRGYRKPANAIPVEEKNKIRAHIEKFLVYGSCHTRPEASEKYLQPGWSISKMYSLYCAENENPKSLTSYSKIFREMNLRTKPPNLDTCGTCDELYHKLSVNAAEKLKLETELQTHLAKVDPAYAFKKEKKLN